MADITWQLRHRAVLRQMRERPTSVLLLLDGKTGEVNAPPPKTRMARTLWALRREGRADDGYRPHQVKAMLDAPFYSRAAVRTQIEGEETVGVHEALDLNRFASPFLKPMLAVRVPRRKGWQFKD